MADASRRRDWRRRSCCSGSEVRKLILSLVLVLTAVAAVPAQRPLGSLRGRIDVRRVVAAPERRPGVAELSTPAARDVPDLRRAVVYLESAPSPAFDERERVRLQMDQRNETFYPHVLAVTVGSVVDFPNSDSTFHNVFSLSKAKRFDLGRYSAGHSRSIRFDRPGIVRVFCDIHSHMSAFILVFSHPYFAVTDSQGRYHIDNVPPGNYGVIAWNEGNPSDPKGVIVPDGGAAELDFALR